MPLRPSAALLLITACNGSSRTTPQAPLGAHQVTRLDERTSVELGAEHAIRSRFADLPLVEPCLATHPALDGHLLVGAIVITDIRRPYESGRLASFLSTDGGATWNETVHDSYDYDPWAAIASDGQAVLAWIGTPGGFRDEYPIQLFRSADGGRTWYAPQTLTGNHDGTKVIAWRDRFWFTTLRFREDMETEIVLYGAEGAGEFEELARIPGRGERLRFCEPAVLADGRVVLPVMRGARAWVQVYDPNTRQLGPESHLASTVGDSVGYARLAADVGTDSPWRDSLYFVRAARDDDDPVGVVLHVSRDGGASFAPGARIDLFPAESGRAALASVAVNGQGQVCASWVDSRADGERLVNDVYLAVSLDGGASFQRPVRASAVSSDPRTPRNDDVAAKFAAGGHYMGLAARADGSFQLVWSDSREGHFALRTRNARIVP
jgi:hypothetical protein